MDISNLSVSNSDNGKKELEERRLKKVVEGTVEVVKRPAKAFLSDDASHVGSYIFEDVIRPTVKKFLYDAMVKAAKILWYGRDGAPSETVVYNKSMPTTCISYSGSTLSQKYEPKKETVSKVPGYFFDNVLFKKWYKDENGNWIEDMQKAKQDAETVLFDLDETVAVYGQASIRDFYDSVGVTGTAENCNYGWRSLESAKIMEVKDGYMIQFPKIVPLT